MSSRKRAASAPAGTVSEPKAPNGRPFGPAEAKGPMAGYRLSEPSPGHTRYALSEDGELLQVKRKPRPRSAKKQRTMPLTDEHKLRIVLAQPEAYRCYDHITRSYQEALDATPGRLHGRPRAYPDALFAAIACVAHHLGGTTEAVHGKIANRPDLVEQIWAGVEAHATSRLTSAQQAARDAGRFPDRSTVLRTFKYRWPAEAHLQALTGTTIPAAIELGYFSGGGLDDDHMHMHADGTVLLSPSKAVTPNAIDLTDGEIHAQRYDEARGYYHEGGGNPVQGAKYTVVGVASLNGRDGFALAVAPVDGPAPAQEYAETLKAVERIRAVLDRVDPDHKQRPIGLVSDSAADRSQIITLQTQHNTLACTPPRPSKARKGNPDGTHIPEVPKEHVLTYLDPCPKCHLNDPLVLVGSTLVRRTPIKTRLNDTPVPFRLKPISTRRGRYFYLQYDCPCGADRRIPFTQLPNETGPQYLARAALMRPWPDVRAAEVFRSHRAAVEGSNGQRDGSYHFKRIPDWGRTSQCARLASEGLGKGLLALGLHREALAQQEHQRTA